MSEITEAQIQARTQKILEDQMGSLVLACARLRAELEAVTVERDALRAETRTGVQGTEQPQTESPTHG